MTNDILLDDAIVETIEDGSGTEEMEWENNEEEDEESVPLENAYPKEVYRNTYELKPYRAGVHNPIPAGATAPAEPFAFARHILTTARKIFTNNFNLSLFRQLSSKEVGEGDICDLCLLLLGRIFGVVTICCSILLLMGALIVTWILMSNFLYSFGDLIFDAAYRDYEDKTLLSDITRAPVLCMKSSLNDSSENVETPPNRAEQSPKYNQVWNPRNIPFFILIIIVPLINMKSPVFFTKFNSLGVIALFYLMLFVTVKASQWGVNVDLKNTRSTHFTPIFQFGFPALTGMLSMALSSHVTVITVMRNNKRQNKNNFLNNFKVSDPMACVGRGCLLFQMITNCILLSYAVQQLHYFLLKGTTPQYLAKTPIPYTNKELSPGLFLLVRFYTVGKGRNMQGGKQHKINMDMTAEQERMKLKRQQTLYNSRHLEEDINVESIDEDSDEDGFLEATILKRKLLSRQKERKTLENYQNHESI
uniref:Uncharacterized protein n=1 Tax=Timema poppense TaxID=170557 RepID=A0A7R9CZA4_TIMPO|nr:unnamed protein product [Timema poppensis]